MPQPGRRFSPSKGCDLVFLLMCVSDVNPEKKDFYNDKKTEEFSPQITQIDTDIRD